MMAEPQQPETRRCVRCWTEFPLTREHFGGRLGNTLFSHHCRACGQRGRSRQVAPILDGRDP